MKFNAEIHTTKESIIQVLKKITKTELKNNFFLSHESSFAKQMGE